MSANSTNLDETRAEAIETVETAWDGLSDDQGPIPAFGPATLDEQGRLVMDDEEWRARSDALRRTLLILPTLTDETDSDQVWANFDPTLGRGDSA